MMNFSKKDLFFMTFSVLLISNGRVALLVICWSAS